MVEHPGDYPWTSYRANAQGEKNTLVTPHLIYKSLGENPVSRQAIYREHFRLQMCSDLVDQIRSATNGNFTLGTKKFGHEIEEALGRRVMPGKSGRPSRKQ